MPFGRPNIDIVTCVIGTALCGSGLRGVFRPFNMATTFGITPKTDTITFFPGIGGRNFAAGLSVFAMTYFGERRALGMLLTAWMCVGFADTRILLTHQEPVKNVWVHVMNTCILAVVGPSLLMME